MGKTIPFRSLNQQIQDVWDGRAQPSPALAAVLVSALNTFVAELSEGEKTRLMDEGAIPERGWFAVADIFPGLDEPDTDSGTGFAAG